MSISKLTAFTASAEGNPEASPGCACKEGGEERGEGLGGDPGHASATVTRIG